MNEIMNNVPEEVMETAADVIVDSGSWMKHTMIGFGTGLVTGIAGTKVFKIVKEKIQDRRAAKRAEKIHKIHEDDDFEDFVVETDEE